MIVHAVTPILNVSNIQESFAWFATLGWEKLWEWGDPPGFGAVRAMRQPLPMCRAEVSCCYEHRSDERGCVNPEFFELPRGTPSFRVVEQSDQAA